MNNERAHEVLLARVDRALLGADPAPVLAPAVDAVAATLAETREAVAHYVGASSDAQLLHARRLTGLLADLVEGALLLDEATWGLARDDARKAVVARCFARSRLAPPRARGILDDDRTVVDLFDPLTRYGTIERAAAAAA